MTTYSKVEKLNMIAKGVNLEIFVFDKDWEIRMAVAEQGYGHEVLVYDENWMVRHAIAKLGNLLQMLIDDKVFNVRIEVAKQRFGLKTLMNDENELVRAEVAKQRFGLKTLMNDESPLVRLAVAKKGVGIETLINDEDKTVKEFAQSILGSKVRNVAAFEKEFDEDLHLYVWGDEDKYMIVTGSHKTDSLDEWYTMCENEYDCEVADTYEELLKSLIDKEMY